MMNKKVIQQYKVENITGASMTELKNDVEYLLFVDNEVLFPMERYTELLPVIEQLADLIIVHSDAAAKRLRRETVATITQHFKEEIGNIIYQATESDAPTIDLPVHEEELDDELHAW